MKKEKLTMLQGATKRMMRALGFTRLRWAMLYTAPAIGGLYSLLFVLNSPLSAQNESAQNVLDKVSKKYEMIQDATLDFSQTIRLGVMKKEQSFDGKLFMKQGKKYRIELEQQTIVTNGTTVWSYSKPNQQVLIDSVKEDAKSFSPEKILLHTPENFYSTFIKNEDLNGKKVSVVKLTPKDDKSFITSMKLWLSEKDSLIKKAEVTDINENFTQYTVNKISVNTGVTDSLFIFSIPADVEVIDLR